MSEVFISYARKNQAFVRDLHAALKKLNRDTWIDWGSIPDSAAWRAEIFDGIEQADNFVFIISPDSVKSWMCAEEVEHAVASKKRLITILYQSVERDGLLPALAELQWVDFPALGFGKTVERLITAIDTDLNWVREHTRFLVRAKEWEANNLDNGFLLHGMELKEAVRWLGQASAIKGRRLTDLQEQYILASEEWEAGEIQRLTDLTEEKERQRQEAERQSHIATARERVAFSALTLEEDPELSVLIAAEAVAGAWHSARTVLRETEEQLRRALLASFVRLTLPVDIDVVVWSPDGQRLATTRSDDGITKVWDAITGSQLRSRRNGQTWAADAWSPNKKQSATLKRIIAKIRRTRNQSTSFVDAARRVLSFSWSPDGKQVATGGYDGDTALVWDVSAGSELRTLSGHSGHILRIAWSPDGKQLATGSDDNTAKVWSVRTGKELCTLKGHAGRILSVAWSLDGKRLATGSNDNTAKVWDAKSGEELRALKGHRGSVRAIAWCPDGKRLATVSADQTVKVWDVFLPTFHRVAVTSVAWSSDGKRLAIGSRDQTAEVRDSDSGEELLSLTGHKLDVATVAWNPAGSLLATGGWDRTTRLWDTNRGGKLLRILQASHSKVWSLAWSPDGKQLATAAGVLSIWDTETGKKLPAFRGTMGTFSVAWSPDGRWLATTTANNLKLWDAKTRKELPVLRNTGNSEFGVAWSPDGRRLATGNLHGPAKIWDTGSGKKTQSLGGRSDRVLSVAWSPDGKRLATGNDDHTARVWDVGSGEELLILYGHRQPVGSVAWSPDGKRLATGSWDGTVQVHAIDIHDLMAIARERVTAHPSKEGCKKYLHVEKCPRVAELTLLEGPRAEPTASPLQNTGGRLLTTS